jgi:ribosome-associated translation inhibitor RaiA
MIHSPAAPTTNNTLAANLTLRHALGVPAEKTMQIQINTDHNLKVHDSEAEQLKAIVQDFLGRFADHITRVEIHLSDENASKRSDDDKRCLLEARPEGRNPVAVSHHASTLLLAVEGACEKMARAIDSDIGRQRSNRR